MKTMLQKTGKPKIRYNIQFFGGRGSRSGAGGGGVLGVRMNAANMAAATPPTVTPGQPVPAITQQQLQNMTDQEFVNYLNGLKSTPIDSRTYYNHDWDTQRLVANMPELNRAPQVVDAATFASMKGETIYRTVNSNATESAVDICGRTLTSDVTTIGEGRMGDGFYCASTLLASQGGYGKYKNDVGRTATMQAKLNSNARVITEGKLQQMIMNESPTVKRALGGMKSGGTWTGATGSGAMAYALRKGYNVVRTSSIVNVIDRNAATWSGDLLPWK